MLMQNKLSFNQMKNFEVEETQAARGLGWASIAIGLAELLVTQQVEKLLAERETIRMKVEAMLDAVAALDPEMAEELR